MLGLSVNKVIDFDIEKICRVCLQTDTEVSPLFDEKNAVKGVYLSDMISECTMYPVCRFDGFPNLICYDCMDRVRIAYAFKKQYEKSHRKLISFLQLQLGPHEEQSADNEQCIRKDNTSLYPCEQCDEKFTNYELLREHRSVAHKGTANLCRLCSKTFNRIGDLKKHIAVCHPKSGHPGTEDSNGLNESGKYNRDGSVVHEETEFSTVKQESDSLPACESVEGPRIHCCKKEIETSEDIATDSQNFEPNLEIVWNDDPADGAGFAEANSDRRAEDEISLLELIHPIIDVTPAKEKPAAIQNDTRMTLKDANHVEKDKNATEPKTKSSSKRRFKCTHCDKEFTRNNHVKRHLLSHSQEKPFSCHICNKAFRRSDHLKLHITNHTGRRKYPCGSCDRSFSRSDHLNRHRQRNHKPAI